MLSKVERIIAKCPIRKMLGVIPEHLVDDLLPMLSLPETFIHARAAFELHIMKAHSLDPLITSRPGHFSSRLNPRITCIAQSPDVAKRLVRNTSITSEEGILRMDQLAEATTDVVQS